MKKPNKGSDEVYSDTLAPTMLPIVWTYMFDEEINCMHGHTGEVGLDVAYDTLTLLPSDRKLRFRAVDHGSRISGARYEIRSTDRSALIEQTAVSDINIESDGTEINVSIQNLLIKDREYLFDLILTTQNAGEVHYYTRIMLTDETEVADEMIKLATDFSNKNFDYELARDNTTYVETDGSADGTTLAYTNLKSTFDNLAYRGLKFSRIEGLDKRLCIYDGNTGEVHLSFMVTRRLSDDSLELYQIDETYSMRMGMLRLYLMNYSREMHEVFTGDVSRLSGKRISLGITDEESIDVLKSNDGRYVYFLSARDLWLLDTKTQNVRCVFSFRSSDNRSVIYNYPEHNIRMIKCDDNGDLAFLLYGYMNRGVHEGETGIAYMNYSTENNLVSESFFIPIARNYQEIDLDVKELAYLGNNDMFYFKTEGNFYGVDTKSDNYIVIATDQKDGNYSVSKEMDKLAWQSEKDPLGSETINVMDLNTGIKSEINAQDGAVLRTEGFIGRDLVISIRRKEDAWMINGKIKSIPAHVVEIIDDDLDVLMHYEKQGLFLDDIEVRDGRVNLTLLKKESKGYTVDSADTIVSSVETPERPEGWGYYNNELKGKVYYVELDDEIQRARIKVAADTDITDQFKVVKGLNAGEDSCFMSYGDGKLKARTDTLCPAVAAAYDYMGHVRYRGSLVYNRPGTVTSRFIDDYEQKSAELVELEKKGSLTSLSGMELKQVLYFVSAGYPVLAYNDKGERVVIYYYDKDQVSLYHPATGEREYPSIDEAAAMFDRANRDYACSFTF